MSELVLNGARCMATGRPVANCPCEAHQEQRAGALLSNATGDAHGASKAALGGSMMTDHAGATKHAMVALHQSMSDNSEEAAKFHTSAAQAHERAATASRRADNEAKATAHDQASALHRKAASMHSALAGQSVQAGAEEDTGFANEEAESTKTPLARAKAAVSNRGLALLANVARRRDQAERDDLRLDLPEPVCRENAWQRDGLIYNEDPDGPGLPIPTINWGETGLDPNTRERGDYGTGRQRGGRAPHADEWYDDYGGRQERKARGQGNLEDDEDLERERVDEENQRRLGLGSAGERWEDGRLQPDTVAEEVSDFERRTGRGESLPRMTRTTRSPKDTDAFHGAGGRYTDADRARDARRYDKRGVVGKGYGAAGVQNAAYSGEDPLPY